MSTSSEEEDNVVIRRRDTDVRAAAAIQDSSDSEEEETSAAAVLLGRPAGEEAGAAGGPDGDGSSRGSSSSAEKPLPPEEDTGDWLPPSWEDWRFKLLPAGPKFLQEVINQNEKSRGAPGWAVSALDPFTAFLLLNQNLKNSLKEEQNWPPGLLAKDAPSGLMMAELGEWDGLRGVSYLVERSEAVELDLACSGDREADARLKSWDLLPKAAEPSKPDEGTSSGDGQTAAKPAGGTAKKPHRPHRGYRTNGRLPRQHQDVHQRHGREAKERKGRERPERARHST